MYTLWMHINVSKVISKKSLVKSSENDFIFVPVFYLIMCCMKAPNFFEKNSHFENLRAGFLLRC